MHGSTGIRKPFLDAVVKCRFLKALFHFLRAQGERIAINAPIQGTSADILKLAMLDSNDYLVKERLTDKVKLVLQIHDELVFEIEKDVAEDAAEGW
jgi:DNA polymerase-1